MDIHIHLTLSRRTVIGALTALLVALPLARLASESVTMTTYYPAPSGVYASLIATNNAFLARDSGSVGLRTITPGGLLDVNGTSMFRGDMTVTTGNVTVQSGKLLVQGSVKVGTDASACGASNAGTMRWTGAALQACDGAVWKTVQLN